MEWNNYTIPLHYTPLYFILLHSISLLTINSNIVRDMNHVTMFRSSIIYSGASDVTTRCLQPDLYVV